MNTPPPKDSQFSQSQMSSYDASTPLPAAASTAHKKAATKRYKRKPNKPLTFATPSTQSTALLLAPIELQKRLILQKLRDSKIKDSDSIWQKEESLRILKAKKKQEKLERVKLEKKVKEEKLHAKKDSKKAKRVSEAETQKRHILLRRHAQESARSKAQKIADSKYNKMMYDYVTSKKAFQQEMLHRRSARKKIQAEGKSDLKDALTSKILRTEEHQESKKRRETNLGKRLNNVMDISSTEAIAQRSRVLKMREEELKKKELIKSQKADLQNQRKLAWKEQLKKNGKIERLKDKREKEILKKEKEWIKTKNQVAVNRATFVDRLDAVVDSTRNMFEQHVNYNEDEKKSDSVKSFNSNDTPTEYKVNIEIDETSLIRGVQRVMTPCSPKDFFKWDNFEEEEGGEGGEEKEVEVSLGSQATEETEVRSLGSQVTEETVKRSNVGGVTGGGNIFSPGDPGLVSPDAYVGKNPTNPSTPKQERKRFEESDIFSPLDPAMTRGYSFSFTPAAVPSDDAIENMSPLQRTYTALKLRRGDDEGIRRMKDLIKNATG